MKAEPELRKAEPEFLFGKIVGFRGLDGEVKVRPSCNSPEILTDVRHLRTKATKHLPACELEIERSYFDKRMYFLCFAGYEDRTSVEPLMGAELLTWQDEILELPEEEFWVKDLVGMTAYKEDGEVIGQIIGIRYSGNDLLEIRREKDPPGKTILVPFVKSIVPTVNLSEKKLIVVDLPGLLEAQ
jgi:16S rRNA processing protein RimM